MRLAVIGAGPAGLYAARAAVRRGACVDIFDALPCPFGLLRYGVAPDHGDTKAPIGSLSSFVRDAGPRRVRFRGNVAVGAAAGAAGVALEEVSARYAGVVHASGAAAVRAHPADDGACARVRTAHEFVMWMNGHPGYAGGEWEFGEEVCVVGVGNVTLDVARLVMMEDFGVLWKSDASPRAVAALEEAKVRGLEIFGRKGGAGASWTTGALREVLGMGVGVRVGRGREDLVKVDVQGMERGQKRMVGLLKKAGAGEFEAKGGGRGITLNFGVEATGFQELREGVEINFCSADGGTLQKECGLALLSLGYEGGAVGEGIERSRCVGWAAGGGKGVIAETLWAAEGVIAGMSDEEVGIGSEDDGGLDDWIVAEGKEVVDWSGWERIDAEERRRGEGVCKGRERVKIESFREMLEIGGM